jgi:hypothetical protein
VKRSRQTLEELARRLPVFDGYPYLVTALVGGLYHYIVLPDVGRAELMSLARRQYFANRLRTCLAVGPDAATYISDAGERVAEAPRCSDPISDRLHGPEGFPVTRETRTRQRRLRAFIAETTSGRGREYLIARMRGRAATADDLVRLSGTDPDGVPVGLARCAVCTAFRGEYLPSHQPRLLVRVFCRCENHNRCARCLNPLERVSARRCLLRREQGARPPCPGVLCLESCMSAALRPANDDGRGGDGVYRGPSRPA